MLNNYLHLDFNFGIKIELFHDAPKEYAFNQEYYTAVISSNLNKSIPILKTKISPGTWWYINKFNYYYPYHINIFGINNEKIIKITDHIFNIEEKNVLFELEPQKENDIKIWLDYLDMFQYKTKCKVFIRGIDQVNQFQIPSLNTSFYASYKINWENNRNHNIFGTNFNSFDLINNQLLRI
jgi:hypothetical protein